MRADKSSGRFVLMDGLRGIAAFAVVLGHTTGKSGPTVSGPELNPNMQLAVPFFFMLSGFVLMHTYRSRIGRSVSILEFAVHRLIRLMPLILVAALIGGLSLFYRYLYTDLKNIEIFKIIAVTVSGFTTLPTPFLYIDDWRWPANPPEWSLFFELLSSGVFAVVLVRLRERTLLVISFLFLIIYTALSARPGAVATGLSGQSALTAFAFPLGCLLSLLHQRSFMNYSIPWWAIVAVTVSIFFTTYSFDLTQRTLVLAVALPWILLTASYIKLGSALNTYAEAAGELSYPIYIIHWPVMAWLWIAVPGLNVWTFSGATFVIAFALSCALLALYDRPTRRSLRITANKWFAHNGNAADLQVKNPSV